MVKYIFANWKENKTLAEAQTEIGQIALRLKGRDASSRRLVILPPVVLLISLGEFIRENSLPLKLGVQDISPHERGSHTGEISVSMVEGWAEYVLLGHSERRQVGESPQAVNDKIGLCLGHGLTPVICVSSRADLEAIDRELLQKLFFIVFEDPRRIGGETAEDPERVVAFSNQVHSFFSRREFGFLYGGSVGPRNAATFLSRDEIDGLLVGHHSLAAEALTEILFS